ncbi:hypothetical protein FRC20_010166 [Serendipita sp. 405]|nr:hypothetical protein FRC20_010166 [Serendipita sp. 405]
MYRPLRPSFDSSFIPAIALHHYGTALTHSEQQEIMYYQDHAQAQHHQQSMGHNPYGHGQHAPLVIPQDYQQHIMADTPSSMDDQSSPVARNDNGKRPSYSATTSSSRKRARKDSDLDAEGSIGENSPQDTFDPKDAKPKQTRGARACQVCRRLKMKCVVTPELKDGPCKRCQAGNHECIFEESNRGKRSSKKHEQLTKSLRKMEKTLDTVLRSISNPTLTSLAGGMVSQSPSPAPDGESSNQEAAHSPDRQEFSGTDSAMQQIPNPATYGAAVAPVQGSPRLHSLPDNVLNPLGLLAEASSSLRRGKTTGQSPLSAGSSKHPMSISTFDNPKVGVANLGDEELHSKLTKLVNKLAWSVPERGYKSVEIVQAYLLLSLWGSPVERYEHDRTWMLLGMAIRMATDLNLHRKNTRIKADTTEGRAREVEIRNRERTWLMCFILDRSFSAQMGKPNVVKEDFIIRDASQWCRQPDALPQDVGQVAYVELQRIVSRSLDLLYSGTVSPSGLQTTCDYLQIIRAIESQIESWVNQWSPQIKVADVHTSYRLSIAKFYYHYSMLVVNSFGLQNAFERSPVDIGYFFGRCHTSATACCYVMRDEIAPNGFLRYAPDSHFVLTSYAVLSLLKASTNHSFLLAT